MTAVGPNSTKVYASGSHGSKVREKSKVQRKNFRDSFSTKVSKHGKEQWRDSYAQNQGYSSDNLAQSNGHGRSHIKRREEEVNSHAHGSCGSRTGGRMRGRRRNFRKSFAKKRGRRGVHAWKNNYAN